MNELTPTQGESHEGSRFTVRGSRFAVSPRSIANPGMRPLLGLLFFLIIGMAAVPAAAQMPGAKEAPPPVPEGVDLRINAEPSKATIGDSIHIDLEVRLPRGFDIRLPSLETQVGDFSILEVHPGPTVPDLRQTGKAAAPPQVNPAPDGSTVFRARIVVALYKTGEFTFPPLDLTLRDGSGKATVLTTPPVKILIQSVLSPTDQALADLKKQADIPEPSRRLLWLALALLAIIAAGLAWWIHRRRARSSVAPSSATRLDPLELAEAEIRDLLGRGFLEKRMVKQFYVALSDIMKRVLEAGYNVAAVEQTTDEILAEMREIAVTGPIPTEELHTIASFLNASDLVKFARYIPSNAENEAAVRNAYQALSLCRRRKGSPAAPESAVTGGSA